MVKVKQDLELVGTEKKTVPQFFPKKLRKKEEIPGEFWGSMAEKEKGGLCVFLEKNYQNRVSAGLETGPDCPEFSPEFCSTGVGGLDRIV